MNFPFQIPCIEFNFEEYLVPNHFTMVMSQACKSVLGNVLIIMYMFEKPLTCFANVFSYIEPCEFRHACRGVKVVCI